MKKSLAAAAMTALITTAAQADTLRIEMGGGIWNNDISGDSRYEGNDVFDADDLGYDDENKGYFWIFIKHPIPILPNIRLEYAEIKYDGRSSESFQWDGITYGTDTYSKTELTQIDTILYYNILDNTGWTTLDLGVDIKYIDASFKAHGTVSGIPGTIESFDESEDLFVPLAYGRLRFEIPMTGIGIEGDVKYLTYQDSRLLDYRVKVDYTLEDILPVDIGVEVGYRFQNIDLTGDDFNLDSNLDLDIDGLFAGVVVRF